MADYHGGNRLPERLAAPRRRLRRVGATASFAIADGDRSLAVRIIAGRQEDLIMLRERDPYRPSPKALRIALGLSEREAEVLAHLARGELTAGIAHALGISAHTVGHHIENVYEKLGVHTRAEAAAVAIGATLS